MTMKPCQLDNLVGIMVSVEIEYTDFQDKQEPVTH